MTRAVAIISLLCLFGCERDPWYLATNSTALAASAEASRGSARVYRHDAAAVAEGKRLFTWYNCAGCHADGGGGMGVALMDERWRYGGTSEAIFASIVEGRPNGMPAFGTRLTVDHALRLAAYVRAMPGGLSIAVAPSRSDDLRASEPESRREARDPGMDGQDD